MGRHGKNLRRASEPQVMMSLGPVDPQQLLTHYEKKMLSDVAKQDLMKKATDTCMAVTTNILLYCIDDLAECPPDERLKLYYGLFGRILNEELDSPNERQQFCEWYWTACTGSPLIRAENEKEYKMAKKYSQELSLALKNRINNQGYDQSDICKDCNISRGVYNNLTNGGSYSKKVFDAVAEYIGLEMDGDLKAMYDTRFGIGNPQQVERMEAMALEIEKAAEPEPAAFELQKVPVIKELAATVETPVESVASAPEEVATSTEDVASAPEDVASASTEDGTLPCKDVNDMYREITPEDEAVEKADDDKLMHPDDIMSNLEFYCTRIPALKEARKMLLEEAKRLEKFIKVLEIMKED